MGTIVGKHVHKLKDLDVGSKTAVCAHCGPTSVSSGGVGVWRCAGAKRNRTNKYHKEPHGLTVGEAQALRAGKSCEICGSTEKLVVDHDHKTLVIRGILCHYCNVAIGFMKDDPDRLRKAASYLEK